MAEHWMGLGETFKVRVEGGEEFEVTTRMSDIVKVERVIKRSWLSGIPQVTDMLSLLWFALRRTGQIDSKDREGWGLTVEDWARVESDDDDGEDQGDGLGPTP